MEPVYETAADRWNVETTPRPHVTSPMPDRSGPDRAPREGALVPPRPQPFDPTREEHDVATMAHENLVRVVAGNPFRATEIVNARPSLAGELIQHALRSGHPAAAQTLTSALRAGYRGGTREQRELLFRSVMRVDGPGAAHIRDVMRSLVQSEQLKAEPLAPGIAPRPLIDPRLAALDAAKTDPATARFRANFFDRPDETAAQLLEESRRNRDAFERHADSLADLIRSSPEAAKRVANAVMQLEGGDGLKVNLRLLGATHEAMSGELYTMDKGINDMRDGGPRARAERLAPLLAQLAARRDTATALARRSRMKKSRRRENGELVDKHTPPLSTVLAAVLDRRLSFETRAQVQGFLKDGAAELLATSLTSAPQLKRASTLDAARFIGSAACAEQENLKLTAGEAAAQFVADVVPLVAKKAADAIPGGKIVDAAGTGMASAARSAGAPGRNWTGSSADALLLEMFEAVEGPAPEGIEGDAAVDAYDARFAEWSTDAKLELELMEECK